MIILLRDILMEIWRHIVGTQKCEMNLLPEIWETVLWEFQIRRLRRLIEKATGDLDDYIDVLEIFVRGAEISNRDMPDHWKEQAMQKLDEDLQLWVRRFVAKAKAQERMTQQEAA